MRQSMRVNLAGLGLCLISGTATATETTTYSYDALGRLAGSGTTGSVNNNVVTSTAFDAAGNRSNYTVDPTGSTPVTLTDVSLGVLPAHASTYSCSTIPFPPPVNQVRSCVAIGTNYTVYVQAGTSAPTFDPGYSMSSNYVLQVTTAAYGTSVSP